MPKNGSHPIDVLAFMSEVVGDSATKTGVSNVVGGMRCDREVATRQFVFALSPGLDLFKAVNNGKIDGLVIANLEVEEGMVLNTAPVSPE